MSFQNDVAFRRHQPAQEGHTISMNQKPSLQKGKEKKRNLKNERPVNKSILQQENKQRKTDASIPVLVAGRQILSD